MQANKIIEHSRMLRYAVAYCGETDVFVVYMPFYTDVTKALIKEYCDIYPILYVTDPDRAKGLCRADGWEKIVDEISGNLP